MLICRFRIVYQSGYIEFPEVAALVLDLMLEPTSNHPISEKKSIFELSRLQP
jgi:hypothetical protein